VFKKITTEKKYELKAMEIENSNRKRERKKVKNNVILKKIDLIIKYMKDNCPF
jgi:hypothetical protein